jgi:hypothetical protein
MGFMCKRELSHDTRMLWAAVLRRAVFDYVLYKGVRAHSLEWKRALRFIFTDGARYELGALQRSGLTFEEVCEIFNWDADYLRRLTTKLTRNDIKKMETTQFREDFVFDIVRVVVEQTEKWKTANFAAPFLPLYRYSPEYREQLRPTVVRRETFFNSAPHMVQWQAVL